MLAIAGNDPSGGAGLLADVRTAAALGVYSAGVVTALTVQNTLGVTSFEPVSPGLIADQTEAVLSDLRPRAVKTGMIPTAAAVEAVAAVLLRHNVRNLVVDPVCVATSGHALADASALQASIQLLMPMATLVTPNIPEAEAITGRHIHEPADMESAGMAILDLTGCRAVLVKGGHLVSGPVADLLVTPAGSTAIIHDRIDTPNTHGTGCTLSSAIAAMLACGLPLPDAVGRATDWLAKAIAAGAAMRMGRGRGPVNHLHAINHPQP